MRHDGPNFRKVSLSGSLPILNAAGWPGTSREVVQRFGQNSLQPCEGGTPVSLASHWQEAPADPWLAEAGLHLPFCEECTEAGSGFASQATCTASTSAGACSALAGGWL